MALIDETVAVELRKAFAALADPVRLVVFSEPLEVPHSAEVAELVQELALVDARLTAEGCSLASDNERALSLGIDRVPAIAVLSERKDHGVRFYGLPGGYEFGSLVEAILDVSRCESGLLPQTRQALAALESDVRIRVFSTPT